MSSTTRDFYDGFADDYHLIYEDWERSVRRQGVVLTSFIASRTGKPVNETRLLDCSCGIGTQAIGLACNGFQVHATDLSSREVARAQVEAAKMSATLTFGVADFRSLHQDVPGVFDVLLSCDNSLPHLTDDSAIMSALTNMKAKLAPGGLLLLSIRDYDQILNDRPRMDQPRVFDASGTRRVTFQVWDWHEGTNIYSVQQFVVRQALEGWTTTCHFTEYRALRRSELSAMLSQAGFEQIRWWMPEESGYYQPIVTAVAP